MRNSTVTISDKPHTAEEIDRWVGVRVKEARNAKGYSQKVLADGLNLTFQQVQKYEKGVNRISVGRLFEIARILEKPAFALLPPEDENDYAPPVLSSSESDLVRRFRRLAKEHQLAICSILKGFSDMD